MLLTLSIALVFGAIVGVGTYFTMKKMNSASPLKDAFVWGLSAFALTILIGIITD